MTSMLACLAVLLAQAPQVPAASSQTNPPSASIEGFILRSGTSEPVYKARIVLGSGPAPKTATTDRYGHFSIQDLAPGRYTLEAFGDGFVRQIYGQRGPGQPGTPIILTADQKMKDVVFHMTPTGTITGRIYDFDNMPLIGADVTLFRIGYDNNGQRSLQTIEAARTNDLGEYRLYWVTPGRYYLMANFVPGPSGAITAIPNQYQGAIEGGYASTYYPGTADSTAASLIDVPAAGQVSAIDLKLIKTKMFKVSGRVVVAVPNPGAVKPNVYMTPRQFLGRTIITSAANMTISPDGTFEIRNVIPGSYSITAFLASGAGNQPSVNRPLDVREGDVEGVVLTISPGFDLPVHVSLEGQPSAALAANPLANIRLRLQPVGDTGTLRGGGLLSPSPVKADGSFTLTQVTSGTYQILLPFLPQDFYIKAMTFDHTDVLQDNLTIDHVPDRPVEIRLSSNGGRLEGTVLDREDKAVSNTQVILIPNERNRSERYKTVTTDKDGHFIVRGIAPGAYKFFAWDFLEAGAYRDPEFVRQYEERGTLAAIVEGSNLSVELRVIPITP